MRVTPNGQNPSCSPQTQKANAEYKAIVKGEENLDPKISEIAFAQTQKGRNRYHNVLPNEPTRFKIPDTDFYFNANWVLDKRAIACQGPLQNEIEEFWKMVWHADVRTIVMLTNCVEWKGKKKAIKCSKYWRLFPLAKETVFENGKEKIVKRTITIESDGKTRSVVQYHLQNWPDFGTISTETLLKLIEFIEKEKGTFLTHCSAGLGRTGALLATFEACRQKTDKVVEIVKQLRHPDKGRIGIIQTYQQYRLVTKAAKIFCEAHQKASAGIAELQSGAESSHSIPDSNLSQIAYDKQDMSAVEKFEPGSSKLTSEASFAIPSSENQETEKLSDSK